MCPFNSHCKCSLQPSSFLTTSLDSDFFMLLQSTVDRHFSAVTFFRGWEIFLKSRIDIFAAEEPRLLASFHFALNRGRDIFVDWMPTAKTAKIW